MILQFKIAIYSSNLGNPPSLSLSPFSIIYSESTVSRLSDPLPHYKQQKPVTHSTHAIRLSFLDRALPTFSPNLFSSCSASAFCPPLSERPLFRFNPVVFLVALRVKIVLSHTPVSLLITFDFTFYIIVFFLCTCQVVTLIKYSVFFDMICAQALYLHNPFSVFLYRLRANKSSRFRMRFVLSSSSFVAFSSCCSPLVLWAA